MLNNLKPYVVDELADDGSDMDSPWYVDAISAADALRRYYRNCTDHGYQPAPRVRVRCGVRAPSSAPRAFLARHSTH